MPPQAIIPAPGFDSERPVFIVGAPRSGTTLLRNLLNRHPALAISSETGFNHYVYRRRRSFGSLSSIENRRRLVDAYLATRQVRKLQMDVDGLRRVLLSEGTSYAAFFASLLRFYAASQGKPRWGEKTPRHAFFTETFFQWFPSAAILHLIRDPRDVVASLRRLPTEPHSVVGAARLWLQCNLSARRSSRRPQYLSVSYERLAASPGEELHRICAFLGEDYSPAMLVPNPDPSAAMPWYRRAEEEVTADRAGKWREELTAEEVALVEWVAGPHLAAFGYQPAARRPASLAIARAGAAALVDAVRRRAAAFPAAWYYLIRSTNLVKEENARQRFQNRNSPASG